MPWFTLAESDFEFKLIPKLQLGNARSRSSASRTQGLLALNVDSDQELSHIYGLAGVAGG